MELTLLLLSLAMGAKSWPQLPEDTNNLNSRSLPYSLIAERELPVVDETESMGTLPVASKRGQVEDWLGDEDANAPVHAFDGRKREQPEADHLPGFVGFGIEQKKRGLVDEWLGDGDADAPIHAYTNSKRSLPTVEETESMGTLPVTSKRDLVDEWLADEDPDAPVHASRSLPVVDEEESMGTLPVASKRVVDELPGFVTLPVIHAERPGLVDRSVAMQLENRSDVAYYAQLSIGSPPQKVYAQLDTGSFELWVNPDCTKLSGGDKTFCEAVGEYDASASRTATETGEHKTLNYGIGAAEVDYVVDDIALSSSAKLSEVRFGVATKTQDQFAGILGIGRGKGGIIKYNNFIDELAEQGVTKTRAFGVALGSKAEGGGVITFGGFDTSKFGGKLAPQPIIPGSSAPDSVPRYWVNMKSMSLTASGKTKTWADTELPVFLDTGATLTLLPPTLAAAIAKDFGADKLDSRGFYTVDCDLVDEDASVNFEFDGVTIRVPYKEIIREVNTSPKTCYLGIVPSEKFTLLGDTFMRSVYAVFDQESDNVFLAQYTNCGSTVKTISKTSDIEGATGSCTVTEEVEESDEDDKEDKPDKVEDKPDKDDEEEAEEVRETTSEAASTKTTAATKPTTTLSTLTTFTTTESKGTPTSTSDDDDDSSSESSTSEPSSDSTNSSPEPSSDATASEEGEEGAAGRSARSNSLLGLAVGVVVLAAML